MICTRPRRRAASRSQLASAAALVDVERVLGKRFGHRGFAVTGAFVAGTVSPSSAAVLGQARPGGTRPRQQVAERRGVWLESAACFSPDGRNSGSGGVGRPSNVFNEGNSEPALLLYPLEVAGAIAHAP